MRFNPEEYIGVAERIAAFYAKFPEGRILTAVVEHSFDTGQVMVRAEVYRNAEDTLPAATGHAYETKGGGGANQTSHVENAETSAVGRAIANLGFDVKRRQNSREGAREARRAEPQRGHEAPPAAAGSLDDRKRQAAEVVAAGDVSEVTAGEQWRVKTKEAGRAVTFNVLKKPGDNFASCGCPDYRAHAVEGDAGYKCVHKLAVVEFATPKK